MEKATDVYNKLKLRFVGKTEMPTKPKTEDNEPEEKETETIGSSTSFLLSRHDLYTCGVLLGHNPY